MNQPVESATSKFPLLAVSSEDNVSGSHGKNKPYYKWSKSANLSYNLLHFGVLSLTVGSSLKKPLGIFYQDYLEKCAFLSATPTIITFMLAKMQHYHFFLSD